jgi:hypothetical protein
MTLGSAGQGIGGKRDATEPIYLFADDYLGRKKWQELRGWLR